MEPTLDIGQRVLVSRFNYHFQDPEIGNIVVFHPPAGAESGGGQECGAENTPDGAKDDDPAHLQRPDAGVPGADRRRGGRELHQADRRRARGPLRIENGHPVVNGEVADEPFIRPCRGSPNATSRTRSPFHPTITS